METTATAQQVYTNGRVPDEDLELRSFFLTASADHEGHAECVIKAYPGRFHYTESHGWLQYNGRCWEKDNAEAAVERAVAAVLTKRRELAVATDAYRRLLNQSWGERRNVTGTRDQLKKFKEVRVSIADFDQDKNRINCQNGVVDLQTGEIVPHSSRQKFTYCLPISYIPGADYSMWASFLSTAVNDDPAVLAFINMAIGYTLTGHTSEEIMFYVYGPSRSGKGTFTETILSMMGHEPLATEADFETFTSQRYGDTQNFDLAPLKPCRFVAASESNRSGTLNAAKIKQMTGGNQIRCAFKHKDHFSYRPQYKIWLSSNHKVNVDVDDDAAWGRLRVISFPNSHLGKEDKGLKSKMLSRENLEGVLAWAVEGAKLWYATPGGLKTPEAISKETADHREQLDDVQLFIDDCAKVGADLYVVTQELYQHYEKWCHDNGFRPKFLRRFSMALDSKGFVLTRKFVASKQQRVIVGIGLLSSV